MKVLILILRIFCVLFFGACVILADNLISQILYLISTSMFGVCVGMDISNIIFNGWK
jgi:hypothetical protein